MNGIYWTLVYEIQFYAADPLLLWADGFCGIVILAAGGRSRLGTAFSWHPVVWLGVISCSLYLIHIPLIDVVWVGLDRLVGPRLPNPGTARWLALASVPIALTVAWGFYHLFEKPFTRVASPKPDHSPAPPSEKTATVVDEHEVDSLLAGANGQGQRVTAAARALPVHQASHSITETPRPSRHDAIEGDGLIRNRVDS